MQPSAGAHVHCHYAACLAGLHTHVAITAACCALHARRCRRHARAHMRPPLQHGAGTINIVDHVACTCMASVTATGCMADSVANCTRHACTTATVWRMLRIRQLSRTAPRTRTSTDRRTLQSTPPRASCMNSGRQPGQPCTTVCSMGSTWPRSAVLATVGETQDRKSVV